MGFISNLFAGALGAGSGVAGAHNAHLAELVIQDMSEDDKKKVADEVINMGAIATAHRVSSEDFCDMFNSKERIYQLNIIALALARLNIHKLPNDSWMPVKNPFAMNISQNDIEVNATYLLRKHNLNVSIADWKIDINEWIESPPF